MKSLGRFLTIATLAVGFAVSVAPNASACGVTGVINQPAVIDQTLLQPAVIDNSSCCDTLSQPAVIDTGMVNSCDSCGLNTTLVQPAVIDNSCGLAPVMINDYGFRRHHLLRLDTPFFGFHLF